MRCSDPRIPEYLHFYDGRKIFESRAFCYYHKIYRISFKDNPIDIPEKWITAISCRWSKLIKKNDVVKTSLTKGNDYHFAFVKEVKNYKRSWVLNDISQDLNGKHEITLKILHSPIPCDYSHSELLIVYKVYDLNESKVIFEEICDYDSWSSESALLKRKKGKFFKEIKKDFRIDMIELFYKNSKKDKFINNLRIFISRSFFF